MDEIQDSLEILKRAFDDVKIIRTEYTRYNQYMLAKKAQAYMAVKQRVETEQGRLEAQEQKRRETEAEQNTKSRRLTDLEEQRRLKEIERAGLLDTAMEDLDRKLEQARGEKAEAAGKVRDWEGKIQDYQAIIRQGEHRVKAIQEQLEQIRQEIRNSQEELEERQEILQWDRHDEAVRLIVTGEYEKSGDIAKSLDLLNKLLAECKRKFVSMRNCPGSMMSWRRSWSGFSLKNRK